MRWKFTIILLILNILAGWYLYHMESRSDLQERLGQSSRSIIPGVGNITRLIIDLRGDDGSTQQRVLVRQRDRWEIQEPVRWPANENAVQSILTQLDFLSEQVAIPLADIERTGRNLAEFGLADPRVVIRYETISGKTGEIKIGDQTRMGRRLYLLPPDADEVLVVSEELLGAIAMPLANLRSHGIFDIPPFEIQSLAVQAGEQRIRLVKNAEANWRFETPVSAQASNELVENTLNMLYGQQALDLIPADRINPTLAGLSNPRMRISIGGNNRRQTLLLGAPVPASELQPGSPPQAYARLDDPQAQGTVFTVLEAPFEHLRQAPDQLRQRNFMDLNIGDISSIQITRSGQSLTLQKLEKSAETDVPVWQALLSGSNAMVRNEPVSTTEVQKLLSLISEVSAVQFVSDSPAPSALTEWGLADPVAQIRLRSQSGTDTTLLLGKNLPGEPYLIYAKTRDNNTVYAIESRLLSALQTSALAFRDRKLDSVDSNSQIVGIRLTDLNDNRVIYNKHLSPSADNWEAALTEVDAAEQQAMLALIDSINNFHVGHYLGEGTQPPEGMPWRYRLEVDVRRQAAPGQQPTVQTRSYLFSARAGKAQVGGSEAANVTFTLPSALIEALAPLTLEANPPQMKATTPQTVLDAKLPPLPEDKKQPAQDAGAATGAAATAAEAAKATAAEQPAAEPQQAAQPVPEATQSATASPAAAEVPAPAPAATQKQPQDAVTNPLPPAERQAD